MDILIFGIGIAGCLFVFWGLIGSRRTSESNDIGGKKYQSVYNENLIKNYPELFRALYDPSTMKIFRQENTLIEFGVIEPQNETKFSLRESGQLIIIYWSHNSWKFGNNSLEWKFLKTKNQKSIYRILEEDINNYEKTLLKGE